MDKNINIPAFNFSLMKFILIVGVVFLIVISFLQYESTNGLKKENKQFKTEIKGLQKNNTELTKEVQNDSIAIVNYINEIEILKASDKKYKQQIYQINKRYEKLKVNYNAATNDERNRIFTNLINN